MGLAWNFVTRESFMNIFHGYFLTTVSFDLDTIEIYLALDRDPDYEHDRQQHMMVYVETVVEVHN